MATDLHTRVRPFEYQAGILTLLDQTLLPGEVRHLDLSTPEEVAEAIRAMRVRGAPAIGIAAAYGVALAARNAEKAKADPRAAALLAADLLQETRPTAVNLRWAMDEMRRAIQASQGRATALEEAALRIHRDDAERCARIAAHGASLFAGGVSVLTHCNTGALATGGVGTALGILRAAQAEGRVGHVFFTETRPHLQGARLTAWELVEDHIPATLIADTAVGALLASGRVQGVVVGADRITARGDVANKIGTYNVAVLAQSHRIPFYVAAPESTLDPTIAHGSEIPIEERSAEEVKTYGGRAVAPAAVSVWNPVFDVTPASLVTAIVTERGVFRPPYNFSDRRRTS